MRLNMLVEEKQIYEYVNFQYVYVQKIDGDVIPLPEDKE